VTTEILYCARCRRVIRPREIAEGRYHFADGDAVCAECFTRLSRRLRPVSGIHEVPKPVDLAEIAELAGGSPQGPAPAAQPAPAAAGAPAAAPASGRKTPSWRKPAGPSRSSRLLVLLAFFAAGVLAGAGAYLLTRSAPRDSGAKSAGPQPGPASPATDRPPAGGAPVGNPGGKAVEKAVEKSGEAKLPGSRRITWKWNGRTGGSGAWPRNSENSG